MILEVKYIEWESAKPTLGADVIWPRWSPGEGMVRQPEATKNLCLLVISNIDDSYTVHKSLSLPNQPFCSPTKTPFAVYIYIRKHPEKILHNTHMDKDMNTVLL